MAGGDDEVGDWIEIRGVSEAENGVSIACYDGMDAAILSRDFYRGGMQISSVGLNVATRASVWCLRYQTQA